MRLHGAGKSVLYAAVLAFCLGLVAGCGGFAKHVMEPTRQPVPQDPEYYGMEFEPVAFESTDGLVLTGWYIPADSDRLIVMTHPNGFNKWGYDADFQPQQYATHTTVEFMNTAKQLHQAGYGVLTFDFRNHGDSDPSADGMTGKGLAEYQDIVGCMEYIASRPDLEKKKLGFLSHGMGANATIIAFAMDSLTMERVDALVAVQPVAMDVFVSEYLKSVYGKPVTWMSPSVRENAERMCGKELGEMSPLPHASEVTAPTLVVQAREDEWTNLDFVRKVVEAIPAEKSVLFLNSSLTRFDMYNYFGENPGKLLYWLDENME
ncbi:MAG: alpha/beta hydrolase [Desulfatibacillaceae bacterium]